MKMTVKQREEFTTHPARHPKCEGYYSEYFGEFDCAYETTLTCDECKYGPCGGRKDPEAKCNVIL
jgi:hypothetical protein